MRGVESEPGAVGVRPVAPLARSDLAIACGLMLLVVALFHPVLGFDFADYDDARYVERNEQVLGGLTAGGLAWAWTSAHEGLWAPLTWMSYQLEAQLVGARPGVMHGTNLVLHACNAALLFVLVRALLGEGARGRAAFVAALFAVHPLHVEPVAWIASRKDVLSTAFGFAAAIAYVGHARGGGMRLAWVAVLLTLGLLAKPMLVTFPLLFLGFDAFVGRGAGGWGRLLREKALLLGIALAFAVGAHAAQSSAGTVVSFAELPWLDRLVNAIVAAATYVQRALWPGGLNALHPHPFLEGSGGEPPGTLRVVLSVIVVAGLAGTLLWRRAGRAWRLGIFWFGLTLLPVLGFVQLGRQAMADRFAYVPMVGLYLALVGSLHGAALRVGGRKPRTGVPVVALVALGALAALFLSARRQLGTWRDAVSVYERALAVNPGNVTMLYNLGTVRAARGERAAAIACFEGAVAGQPLYGRAHHNLAVLLEEAGELERAVRHYDAALRLLDGELREAARRGLTRTQAAWAARRRGS